MMNDSVELVIDAKSMLGEGSIWDSEKQVLYWVNILENQFHIYDPCKDQKQTLDVGPYVSTVVPRKSGGVMVTIQHGFGVLDLNTGKLQMIHDPEIDIPNNRFNDGKCDPTGRFWAGTMPLDASRPVGNLYCMDPDHTVRRMLPNVTISNGIVWSLDHKIMYYIDSPTLTVDAFDYDIETGSISNRRVAVHISEQNGCIPDGMTLDAEGMLWVAVSGGWQVQRWNPLTGKLLQSIRLPVSGITSCAFGGPNLDQLYITTAREELSDSALAKEPLAGGLFRANPGVKGVEANRFAG